MGDNNVPGQHEDGRQYSGRVGMDALMSAIDVRGRYNMVGNIHDHKSTSNMQREEKEKESIRASQLSSQAASLYSHQFPANALAATNSLWGLNPMLLPFMFPGLRPDLSGQIQPNLSPQAAAHWAARASESNRIDAVTPQAMKCILCGAICSDAREFQTHLMQKHSNAAAHSQSGMLPPVSTEMPVRREARYPESIETNKGAEMASIPTGYPGLPYSHLSADQLSSVHEAAAKAMRYPTQNPMNPYLGLSNFQNFATNAGLLQTMTPNSWSTAVGGALHPYYQRLPGFSQFAQNPLLRMQTDVNALHGYAQESVRPKLEAASLLDQNRPQSGGYSPLKESLQRRLSAPLMQTASQSRIPGRSERSRGLEVNKAGPSYPGFHHGIHLPSKLIAPSVDTNASANKIRIDHKSIEEHIKKLISHNEKILHSPTLDKVKPRRVFRRSSLDPASLNTSVSLHNPLTATHSAPRSLDPKYSKSFHEDSTPGTDHRHKFLTVPSRMTEPDVSHNIASDSKMQSPVVTYIPDPRRDLNTKCFVAGAPNESKHTGESILNRNSSTVSHKHIQRLPHPLQRTEQRPKEASLFHCNQCGAQFSRQETYDVHKEVYCPNHNNVSSTTSISSSVRQSVIQHTRLQSTEDDEIISGLPEVKVSPPDSQNLPPFVSQSDVQNASQDSIIYSQLLENPLKYIHKDIHRSHSADTAFQISRNSKLVRPNADENSVDQAPSKMLLSPPKSDQNETKIPQEDMNPSTNKSSIPTNKLPPKKKQLQLMRSNGSNQTHLDITKSPKSNPSPLTLSSDTSPNSHGSKTPESPERYPSVTKPIPPSSLSLETSMNRKALPRWIPLEVDEKLSPNGEPCGVLGPAPTIYLPDNPNLQVLGTSGTGTNLLPSPTGAKSPTSPRSPTRRLSPGRGSRSPSRSPTSSLESTIPRSNYKLLLHQISLRNMQDMDYLSEAYHHSKDKTLKRNIASLLWSSDGTKSAEGGTSPKRARPFPYESPKMDELYPGKALLARRLSPNAGSGLLRPHDSMMSNPNKTPLSQTRSRPYEGRQDLRPSVTRSHSTGNGSDVNNNIKQFLQNKSRNQQQQSSSGNPPPTKTHKPLTRTNANARYLLKSPNHPETQDAASNPLKRNLESRKSLSKLGQSSLDSHQLLKESLALKRASSYNPESTVDYQSKRQRLIPIPKQSTTISHTTLPTSLVTSRLTGHDSLSMKKEVSSTQSIHSTQSMQTPFMLHPHLTPSLGYEPHPTFCSLVSPQPMYVEHQQSTLSMYSQWAVSKPLMLPDGLTVMDLFQNSRMQKGLSPYISYNSLFMTAKPKEKLLKLTDTKEYETNSKEKSKDEDQKLEKPGENQSEPVEVTNNIKPNEEMEVKMKHGLNGDASRLNDWMFSRTNSCHLLSAKACYTSCHNKTFGKITEKLTTTTATGNNKNPEETKIATVETVKKMPKLPPPEVIIHPPSPIAATLDNFEEEKTKNPNQKNNDISALEFSDSDSDDSDALKIDQPETFLKLEKEASPMPKETPPSDIIQSQSGCSKTSNPLETNKKLLKTRKESSTVSSSLKLCRQNGEKCNSNEIDTKSYSDHCDESMSSQGHSSCEDNNKKIKNKKIRKSRKERNASSPRLQKTSHEFPDSPSAYEDPSLAVHPTGACSGSSDDPSKLCALCSMKAGNVKCPGAVHSKHDGDERMEKCEDGNEHQNKGETSSKPNSPAICSQDRPPTPSRPRTPNSSRPKTPVPLTVSVPKHTRDKSLSKGSRQSLAPGILDKARGNGTTQHWVTTSDLQSSKTSEPDEKTIANQSELKTDKSAQNINFSMSEYYSAMPPNKNPVLELNLQKLTESTSVTSAAGNGGLQALAAVVSGVMRSAAIQSKKKTKSSKHGMTEMLSHSRPLIPTSELNGSATKNHDRLSEKLEKSEIERKNNKITPDNMMGSISPLPSGVGQAAAGKHSKPSLRHLSLSTRESELFLNKANETKTSHSTGQLSEPECDTGANWSEDHDVDEHSDSAKEDTVDGEGESSNPRPHKCSECKVAFRIAGHLAKHLRSKGHIIAMQKKTLNRLKQQKFSIGIGQENCTVSASLITTGGSPEHLHYQQQSNQDELMTQLGEGAETLARAQVRALFEGNEEYAEINTGTEYQPEFISEIGGSDDEGEYSSAGIHGNSSDPRPFKCIACKVAFRFQGHLDRHFRSNMHLLAVGHFERDKTSTCENNPDTNFGVGEEDSYSFTEFRSETLENGHSPDQIVHNNDMEENHKESIHFAKNEESELNILGKNGLNYSEKSMQNNNAIKDQNRHEDGNNNFIENDKLRDHDSNLTEYNQRSEDCDSLRNTPIKINCESKPINGLNTHALIPDSLSSMSIKRQSPIIQSNSKTLFEAPTLPEVPLPSSSPVQNRQQLTC